MEQRLSEYMADHPQKVEVLERDEIKVRNFLNAEEAIRSMSGVEVQPSGTGLGARISIRGPGAQGRVSILVNGRPADSSQYGSAVIGDIPLSMIERIEVFKPPVPVWLGAGASAGKPPASAASATVNSTVFSYPRAQELTGLPISIFSPAPTFPHPASYLPTLL